jgi:hypothetical protein
VARFSSPTRYDGIGRHLLSFSAIFSLAPLPIRCLLPLHKHAPLCPFRPIPGPPGRFVIVVLAAAPAPVVRASPLSAADAVCCPSPPPASQAPRLSRTPTAEDATPIHSSRTRVFARRSLITQPEPPVGPTFCRTLQPPLFFHLRGSSSLLNGVSSLANVRKTVARPRPSYRPALMGVSALGPRILDFITIMVPTLCGPSRPAS